MKLTITDVTKEIESALKGIRDPIAKAATAAVTDAGAQMKSEGRANIGAAGFSSRWQNAWRVSMYPKGGVSIDAVAYGRHNIFYSGVFEDGATIAGKNGLLWLPLSSVPRVGRRKPTPALLKSSGVNLFTMKNPHGGAPLLATRVRIAGTASKTLTLAKLRKGTAGVRGQVRSIPLFVGVKSVTLRKRFALDQVAQVAQQSIAARYVQYVSEFTG